MTFNIDYIPRSRDIQLRSDHVRVLELINLPGVDSVTTANNFEYTDMARIVEGTPTWRGHISSNFKTTINGVTKHLITCQPDLIILDYFWLERKYYDQNYGVNWTDKVSELFGSMGKLKIVILPIDKTGDIKCPNYPAENHFET